MLNRISIDGYFASLNKKTDGMDWFLPDPEADEASHRLGKADTVVLGKNTFLLFERTWVPILNDPKAPEPMKKLARELTDMQKVVFSTSLKTTDWENTTFYEGDLPGVITKLKGRKGDDIMIMGSGSLVQQLTKAGLIDEYVLIVTPIIAGEGKPLFKEVPQRSLELLSAKSLGSGNVLSHYQASR
jgi:dihydrofolate reductase